MRIDRRVPAVDEVTTPALADLCEQRSWACRLAAEHALQTLDEAETFAIERGMLTLTPDCALPSLFAACHEESYRPGGRGFASWPKTRWRWGAALAERPGIYALKLHRGKTLFLTSQTVALVDPLCRQELGRAARGVYGHLAVELLNYLAAAGPSPIEDVKRELGLDSSSLHTIRERLERVGALVSRALAVPAKGGGERETSELARWDQRLRNPPQQGKDGLEELVVAGVRAAVVVPESEIPHWFSWPLPASVIARLIETGRLRQPQKGWIAEGNA
jgi:hypothetical protein